MHGIKNGLSLLPEGQDPEFDLAARISRWDAKAQERGEKIAIPSNHIHDPDALIIEHQFKKRAAQRALSLIDKPGMRVLDIGCGGCVFASHFIPGLLERDGTYVGIDQCQWTIDFGWQYLEQHGIVVDGKSVTLTPGLASRLTWGRARPFQQEFDLVIAGQLNIHIVSDEELNHVAEQKCEVLKLGGYVFEYEPCCDLNPQYQGVGAQKNQDTHIRYEREIVQVSQPHNIIPVGTVNAFVHDLYFGEEIYTFFAKQKVELCPWSR